LEKILVIGSNSFSGASFVSYALSKGANVYGVSRSPLISEEFLPFSADDTKSFRFSKIDINHNVSELGVLVKEYCPDYVVNFAAQSMVAESWESPTDWYNTNVVGTANLLSIFLGMRQLKRYVHVSTPEVYGSCTGFVTEDNAFHPSTPYAVSRAAGDMHLRALGEAYDFPFVITRAANVYGAYQQLYRIIPKTIMKIMGSGVLQLHGGGVSTRSFIHIRDVCSATWLVMKRGVNGDTYHISTKEIISIKSLVEMICERLGVDFVSHTEISDERLGKDASYQLSSEKIRNELGWEDSISLSSGLGDCIAWVKKHYDTLKDYPLEYQHKV
jgi:dTDP-glucose 4,6-dehydratase